MSTNVPLCVGRPDVQAAPDAAAEPLLVNDRKGRFGSVTEGLLPAFNTTGANRPRLDAGVKFKGHRRTIYFGS